MIAALLVAMAMPEPAAAQLEPRAPIGSRIKRDPEAVVGARAGAIRKGFARCIYQRNPRSADRLLRSSDYSTVKLEAAGIEPRRLRDEFGMERCLGGEASLADLGLKMKLQTLRVMLLEEAYLAAVKTPPTPLTAEAPAVVRAFVSTGEKLERAKIMGNLADCIVVRDAVGADALLRTAGETGEEGKAARALVPAVSSCITEGLTVRLTLQTIRALAADGLWQRYIAGPARPAN